MYAKDSEDLISQPVQTRVYKGVMKGDVDVDGDVDLTDALMALRVLAGNDLSGLNYFFSSTCTDINGDGKIGLEELGYILEKVSGLRN